MNTSDLIRVFRGGSWYSNPAYLRSARRIYGGPAFRFDNVGFRLVRVRKGKTIDHPLIIRGGSAWNDPDQLRSANIRIAIAEDQGSSLGLRLVRTSSFPSSNEEAVKLIKQIRAKLSQLEKMLK